MGAAEYVVMTQKRDGKQRPKLPKAEREATPPEFAKFLYLIAIKCSGTQVYKSLS
jgi:hypothetical protein